MALPKFETHQEAKDYLRKNFEKGCKCPTCGQRVQLYNYKLFASSAFALIRLSKLGAEWHHIKDFAEATDNTPRAPHFAELRFWKMVEPMPLNSDPKKKASGFWRITQEGRLFVAGMLEVQSRILVYNNNFVGFAKNAEIINIKDALGNEFNYEELIKGK